MQGLFDILGGYVNFQVDILLFEFRPDRKDDVIDQTIMLYFFLSVGLYQAVNKYIYGDRREISEARQKFLMGEALYNWTIADIFRSNYIYLQYIAD